MMAPFLTCLTVLGHSGCLFPSMISYCLEYEQILFCWHFHTSSHSTTLHPMNRARRWYTVVTLLYDLCSGFAIFILNGRGENRSVSMRRILLPYLNVSSTQQWSSSYHFSAKFNPKTAPSISSSKFVLLHQCDQIGRFIGLWATF